MPMHSAQQCLETLQPSRSILTAAALRLAWRLFSLHVFLTWLLSAPGALGQIPQAAHIAGDAAAQGGSMSSSARLAAAVQLMWQGCSLLNISGGYRHTSPDCCLWGQCFGLTVDTQLAVTSPPCLSCQQRRPAALPVVSSSSHDVP